MTREEAIEKLAFMQQLYAWWGEEFKAFERAIEALKAQDRPIICPRCGRAFAESEGRSEDEPQGDFDGMIFSTDKYMAFIDKKEIHIMRKDAHKVTIERTFNTEKDEYKPMPKHGQSADRPRPIDPTIKVDLESGVVPISACEPKAPKTIVYADRVYAERPRGRWHYSDGKPATIGQSFGVICDQCGTESEYCTNFCGECGADMRGDDK